MNGAGSHRPPSGSPLPDSDANYEVGYAKPPEKHRFQAGQSGNPKGRPKGSKNTATLRREILDRKLDLRTAGKVRKITVREAFLTRFAEAALKGDTKAATFILRDDEPEQAQQAAAVNAPEKQEIIETYGPILLKKLGAKT